MTSAYSGKNGTFLLKNISSKLIINSEDASTKYFRIPFVNKFTGIMILNSEQVQKSRTNPNRYDICFDRDKEYTLGKVFMDGRQEVGIINGNEIGGIFSDYIKYIRRRK